VEDMIVDADTYLCSQHKHILREYNYQVWRQVEVESPSRFCLVRGCQQLAAYRLWFSIEVPG
jgi:hypothetical protein